MIGVARGQWDHCLFREVERLYFYMGNINITRVKEYNMDTSNIKA